MDTYFVHPELDVFQPERRNGEHSSPEPSHRVRHATRTTQAQYDFLRDCLLRRETLRQSLRGQERRVRHVLVACVALFFAFLFGSTKEGIELAIAGTHIAFTIVQMIAVAPMVITYLVMYGCTLGAHQTRVEQESWAIDAELQRFGCPTSYSVVEPLREYCSKPDEEDSETQKFASDFHGIFFAHDALLGSLVIGAYVVASVRAFNLYHEQGQLNAIVLTAWLTAATLLAAYAVKASAGSRRSRGIVFHNFRRWKAAQLPDSPHDRDTNGRKNAPSGDGALGQRN